MDRAPPPDARPRGGRGARPPGTCPTWRRAALVPEPGRTRVHRRGDALLVPGGRRRARRWSASTAARPRAEIAPAARRRDRPRRHALHGPDDPRAAHALGVLLVEGAMSFNWRLLLAPAEVLDYVVEHEVCHLEVMDHSPRFWALLESRVPDWRAHAALAAPLRVDARRSERRTRRSASYGVSRPSCSITCAPHAAGPRLGGAVAAHVDAGPQRRGPRSSTRAATCCCRRRTSRTRSSTARRPRAGRRARAPSRSTRASASSSPAARASHLRPVAHR